MANVPISNLTTTWNDGATTFSGVKLNVTDTASASGSLLMDLQVGGTSLFQFRKDGGLYFGAFPSPTIKFANNSVIAVGVYNTAVVGANRITLSADGYFSWSGTNNNPNATIDLIIARDAAGILAQRNGNNAQTFRLYGTYDDASNNAFASFNHSTTGNLTIQTAKNGTGTSGSITINAGTTATVNAATSVALKVDGEARLTVTTTQVYCRHTIIPTVNNLDIGTSSNRWRTIYLSAGDIVTDTTTGTKIGTGTTQKLAFWNATPVVQPTTGITAGTFAANTSGISNDTATFDGYTIGQVVAALRQIGVLA